jgi:hypothetical protein
MHTPKAEGGRLFCCSSHQRNNQRRRDNDQETHERMANNCFNLARWVDLPHRRVLLPPLSTVRLVDGRICTIIGKKADGEVEVQILPFFTEVYDRSSPLYAAGVILPSNMSGVTQVVYDSDTTTCSVSSEFIKEVVFVLSEEEYEREYSHRRVVGCKSVFVIRYDTKGENMGGGRWKMFADDWDGFPFPMSQPKNIWNGLVATGEELRRIVGTTRDSQGPTSRQTRCIQLHKDVWEFIQWHVSSSRATSTTTIDIRPSSRRCKKRRLESNLSLSSTTILSSTQLIRFETVEHAEILRRIFGDLIIADVRKLTPKIGTVSHLFQGDIINYIDFSEHEEEPFRKITKNNGVDLEFDGKVLRIQGRYSSYVVIKTRRSHSLVNCPSELLQQLVLGASPGEYSADEIDLEDSECQISVGAQFRKHNHLYRVIKYDIANHVVKAKCIYPPSHTGEYEFQNTREVSELVKKFLFG